MTLTYSCHLASGGLLGTAEHQTRKGIIMVAVLTDPITMWRDTATQRQAGRSTVWYLGASLGHRSVRLCSVITVNGKLQKPQFKKGKTTEDLHPSEMKL